MSTKQLRSRPALTLAGLALVLASTAVIPSDAFAGDVSRGKTAYKLCASCHGFKGEGNQLVNAPALAGQEAWYLERQVRMFRDRIRGDDRDDDHGRTMATMSLAVGDDDDIADIVAYIGTLPEPSPASTVDGDVALGKTQYATCSACHGVAGEGNQTLNAPSLLGLDDWYQLAQLKKFKSGQRGANPADVYGQQMAPMAATLADAAAMQNVVAYIMSLQ